MNKPVMPAIPVVAEAADRRWQIGNLSPRGAAQFSCPAEGALNRIAFSAAHVVADPLADVDPWLTAAVDWDNTIAFREHIWDLGLGVAEAMDTAQRGMGLDWPTSLELIRRSVRGRRRRGRRRWCFPAPAPTIWRPKTPRASTT